MDEVYSKLEMERMVCWADSIRKYYRELQYKVPETIYITAIQNRIDKITDVIRKWQRIIDYGETIYK